MRVLITGVGGFIGSSIADRLLEAGVDVVGIDCFTTYYDPSIKRSNLENAMSHSSFSLYERDLATDIISDCLEGVTHVYHQAGQPGVRASWGEEFENYLQWNVVATQRLLETSRLISTLEAFVAASSSSIYGSAESFPTSEQVLPNPISPYGVTKLAAENLCTLYGTQFGLPTVSLRYFTVFGPRQRPDMAFQRIIEAALSAGTFPLNGTGEQVRDFTFIDDIVDANIQAAMAVSRRSEPIGALNVGGGNQTTLSEAINFIAESLGRSIKIVYLNKAFGDPLRTAADTSEAHKTIGWKPKIAFLAGLQRQIDWNLSRR